MVEIDDEIINDLARQLANAPNEKQISKALGEGAHKKGGRIVKYVIGVYLVEVD